MRIVNAQTGVTEIQTLRVHKGISKLLIQSSAAIGSETISLKITRKQGRETKIAHNMPIHVLAEISQHGEGANFVAGAVYNYTVSLTPKGQGSIDLANGDELVIDVAGLTGANTYSVYGLEAPGIASQVLIYDIKNVAAGTSNQIPLTFDETAYICAVDKTNVDSLELTMKETGQTLPYLAAEVAAVMYANNDLVLAGSSPVYGYNKLYIFGTTAVRKMIVYGNGSAFDVYTVSFTSYAA